jgi:galactokinase
MNIEIVKKGFALHFNEQPTSLYTAPGRINIIGEHTDYNGGFVFPAAIDKGMFAAIKPNGTNCVRAVALDLNETAEFGLEDSEPPKAQWAKYIFGVCREISKRGGRVGGFNTAFAGDVPLGAGMSSSAALESVYAFALNEIFELNIDKFELAKIGQATEHNYVGVKCGIMDQFASLFGRAGNIMLLDCRSLEHKYYPFNPEGYKLVLLDTCVKHILAENPYNKRRESCERVAAAINKKHSEVQCLRDATLEMLDEIENQITQEDFNRAKYVIEEVERVMTVCEALEKNDFETVGKCMFGTHKGMSELYEVSCEELDFLNEIAEKCGVTGSRVMGGGFGGCTINLVKSDLYDAFINTATTEYAKRFGREPKLYEVVISDGARKLS